jgi:threonine synthase
MRYFSTNRQSTAVGFREALFQGLAPDRGLYLPESFPEFNRTFYQKKMTYIELASEMIQPFVSENISSGRLLDICKAAFTFDIPLVYLIDNIFVLELFHGPTMAFKDFAARFMARCMEYLLSDEITILVATSGDTGSAVANGFFGLDGIQVVILYPSGRVSAIQEQQLTTYGGNITALEVEGTFDDCQQMVKEAFLDQNLNQQCSLTSANSINIARLLPQSVYYAWAWKQIGTDQSIVFSVPSGNFGNLTGGIIAKHMGLPVEKFIAATNANDVFPKYLETGEFNAMPSKQTISNAMDVGMPSNFDRILKIYNENVNELRRDLTSWSFQDNETKYAIKYTKNKLNYLADPHTAVGLSGIEKYRQEVNKNLTGIALATAHPGKFPQVVEPVINEKIVIPKQLQKSMEKEKNSIIIPAHYSYLKEFLIHN